MTVDTEVGVGTTFYFSITFGLPESQHIISERESLVEYAHLAGLNILLAEDEKVNQMSACRQLELLGHKVTAVENGNQALEVLRQESFDLVVMDIQMPIMDGLEATKAIRNGYALTG